MKEINILETENKSLKKLLLWVIKLKNSTYDESPISQPSALPQEKISLNGDKTIYNDNELLKNKGIEKENSNENWLDVV